MNGLDEALTRAGTDQRAVVASVERAVRLGQGDVLLAVGSLVEGLGTSKSDVDLLLVRASGPEADGCEMETAWMLGSSIVDLRVVPAVVVEELLARLATWDRRPWSVMDAPPFSPDERLLLHRLLRGRPMFPAEQDDAVRYRPPAPQLERLKLQVTRHLARTIQVDMVGYRENGDYSSLVFAGQELLGHAVDALLAAHHQTNPYPKWRSRLLESLPADWDRALVMRPAGRPPGRLFWDLHRAPAEAEPDLALAHARRCAGFARAVFAWAEPRLVESSALEEVHCVWRPGPYPPEADHLPHLELDVDFFLSGGSITVARLNHLGGSLRVSAPELAVLLLFDGETSASEAERAIAGHPAAAGEVDVAGLVERARGAGLCGRYPAVPGSRA